MSTTTTLLNGSAPATSIGARIAVSIDWLAAAYKARRAFHVARSQLMALDDRMLRDIGLDRSEITSALKNENGERLNGVAQHPILRSIV